MIYLFVQECNRPIRPNRIQMAPMKRPPSAMVSDDDEDDDDEDEEEKETTHKKSKLEDNKIDDILNKLHK